MAENTGFEPADALTSTVFKTAALNHSANSPHLFLRRSENRCNGLPKQNARFVLSFCWVNESAWLEDFSIYLGLRPKTAALNHSANSPHLFLRRSENRCNGLPKRDAWFDIKFCRVTFD